MSKNNNDSFIIEIYILFERVLNFTKIQELGYVCDH